MTVLDRARALLLGEAMPTPEGLEALLPENVVLRSGRLIPRIGGLLARMGGPAAAVTLGRTIVVNPDVPLSPSLLVHELTHVRQWEKDAWFPVRYTAATLRHGYRDNPYEVEARVAAAFPTNSSPSKDLT